MIEVADFGTHLLPPSVPSNMARQDRRHNLTRLPVVYQGNSIEYSCFPDLLALEKKPKSRRKRAWGGS